MARKAMRLAWGIGTLYALAGVAWILTSDALVQTLSDDAVWRALAQRYKGLFYVVASAAGLVVLVRWGCTRLMRALERQEAQFRQLHQSLGEVLWLTSRDGSEVLYVSPAFERVYGRPRADIETDTDLWLSMVHEDDRVHAEASIALLRGFGHSSCEYRIRRPDGAVRWISDRKKAIVDEEGRVTLIGGIAEDITASKELDQARASTQAELERRVGERTAELERVNAELNAFARTAAHDLKTPLNGIVGFGDLLQMKYGSVLGEDGLRLTRHIATSARQMANLVNDLLTLSMATTTALNLTQVDIAALARDAFDELARQEPDRSVSFDAPTGSAIWCDRGLAASLVAKLVGNAWKFTGRCPHGEIRMTLHEADGGTVVSLHDNGVGFDAAKASRLFEPFQRFHSARQFGGTGIGLATCQRIVRRHGGAIWAESRPGEGTTISFLLPAPGSVGQSAPAQPLAA
jgi:PAS domain S-box-containing protein